MVPPLLLRTFSHVSSRSSDAAPEGRKDARVDDQAVEKQVAHVHRWAQELSVPAFEDVGQAVKNVHLNLDAGVAIRLEKP